MTKYIGRVFLNENLGFASMRRSGQPLDIPAYLKAHSDAEVREVKIRTALKISGGFGGARMTSLKED